MGFVHCSQPAGTWTTLTTARTGTSTIAVNRSVSSLSLFSYLQLIITVSVFVTFAVIFSVICVHCNRCYSEALGLAVMTVWI